MRPYHRYRGLKVLPLEKWMKRPENPFYFINFKSRELVVPKLLKSREAVFHRDGFYLLRQIKEGICWFEYNGKAWTYDEKYFKFLFKNICSEYED